MGRQYIDEYIELSDQIEGIQPTKKGVFWRMSSIPGIMVSECGDLWDSKKGKLPPIYKLETGILAIVINVDGVIYKSSVAKLVYEAFCGKIPKGQHLAHKDRIKANDDLANLILVWNEKNREILSSSGYEVLRTMDKNKKEEIKPKRKKTNNQQVIVYENGVPVKVYDSLRQYCKEKFVNYVTVWNYLNGKCKKPRVVTEDIRYSKEHQKRKESE